MNVIKIKELQDFVKWVSDVSNYSASLETSFTSCSFKNTPELSYRLWISTNLYDVSEGLYDEKHDSIDLLAEQIPVLKKRILNKLLAEVA